MLWDIDHTLVDYTGIGRSWYVSALRAMGVELHTHPDYSGRTERAISTDALASHGVEPTEDNIQRLWRELITLTEEAAGTLHQAGRALDGASAALAAMAEHGAVQTLVTGNLPEISRHKLSPFDLDEHLELEIGGYGSLSVHRPDLVPHAVAAAAAKHGTRFAPEQVVIIGDTPHDVRAALDHGAVAVAVATGHYSADELAAAGAHTVLPDLADPESVRQALLG
jgi:phosphoglycolate phosphatase-like HAD superfamily hydrolase